MLEQLNQQSELWQDVEKHRLHAELCNAFYAREILRLSKEQNNTKVCRILASLPFYIERAAVHILAGNSPLQLDSQNGSWIAKQAAHPPEFLGEKVADYYRKNAKVGLIVPIVVCKEGMTFIKLDSIDEIQNESLHCNQHGWFSLNGSSQDCDEQLLIKPTKASITAACCGHVWLQQKRTSPRRLALREMLLAANLNWLNFAKPFMANRR
ncbi:hypothetical protein [Pseudoalteromonas tunicata]|uniref:Putative orphan protein n=1 Tax=Pseudoalteromonas tunicata D2 TaxID=87626 RepID=A4C6Z9_9GAMM|nr:hypothetical protein [Pseudoalteromonas tunicata]ATC95723.1 hypothetical protein PTUN_a3382 [Pseudoalteromonas tunicata]AXT31279.1 hypothetical protein D1819_10970 [Pseudoalteromonas tunicata]EAR29753.1 putative orphan protein [Pseudoalteromonas tunicata D2]MDP4985659.1 hypothetical protein [Pseudoalteromonas tunicata]